jgi:hypothetical protein
MSDEGKKRPVRSYIAELARGKRSLRFMIRLSSEEREHIERKARQTGLSLSAFMRRAAALVPVERFQRKRRAGDSDSGPPSSGAIE